MSCKDSCGEAGATGSGFCPAPESLEPSRRAQLIRRGLHLTIFTVVWNVIEGIVAIGAGIVAGSVALVGFGVDSFAETASAVVVGWRFAYEMGGRSPVQSEKAELWTARVTGTLLLILALYILLDSGRLLLRMGREPEPSLVGILLTLISLAVMPFLGRAKLRVAGLLHSRSLRADAYESITCAWLSGTTLAGLALNALLGWWWTDPVAAMALIPLIVREGLEGLRGDAEDE